MSEQLLGAGESKNCVSNAAVIHIDFGRFDQSFPDIGMPWFKSSHEKQINEKIGYEATVFPSTPMEQASSAALRSPDWWCANMVQNRLNVSAGMRGPNSGISRSR